MVVVESGRCELFPSQKTWRTDVLPHHRYEEDIHGVQDVNPLVVRILGGGGN